MPDIKQVHTVQLSITDGPVIIRGLNGAEVAATHDLWDGSTASEYFPSGADDSGANYVVTLKKEVSQLENVRSVEDELIKALLMLVEAWPFAGGSHMMIETRQSLRSPQFESNADVVEQQMLAASGLKKVSKTFKLSIMTGATYAHPPLTSAIQIAQSMRADLKIRRLIHYYHQAQLDRTQSIEGDAGAWCLNLFKVRDFLSLLYGEQAEQAQKRAKEDLGISTKTWTKFGHLLNTRNLRHAELDGTAPPISAREVDWLYATAHGWIHSYLRTKGLPSSSWSSNSG